MGQSESKLVEEREIASQLQETPTWSADLPPTQMADVDVNDPDPAGAYARRHQQGLALAEADRAARERLQEAAASTTDASPASSPFTWATDDETARKLIPAPFRTMAAMRGAGHHRWGLVMYRVWYGDEEAWQNFLRVLKWCFHVALQNPTGKFRNFDRLAPYLRWTTFEDRQSLEGASKETVRAMFRDWVAARTDERDGAGASREGLQWFLPRYRYCLYVDADVMRSVKATVLTMLLEQPQVTFEGTLVLLDSRFGTWPAADDPVWRKIVEIILPSGRPLKWFPKLNAQGAVDLFSEEYEPVDDGRTTWDVGFMIVPLDLLFWLYNQLSEMDGVQRLGLDPWVRQYVRPPARYEVCALDVETDAERDRTMVGEFQWMLDTVRPPHLRR